ncbi:MAG: site-specific DNA-methyltransferase [Bacteroidota bacterium]
MIFWGENLSILKYILGDRKIAGKVKQIYIDPPFATNQNFRSGKRRTATISSSNGDGLAYNDTLTGAAFLEFLRRRLYLLRELLSEDGSIYLHIDYKIGHYVKVLMDEIFGQENFINDITRIKCNPKNFSRKGYGNIKDMILFYARSKKFTWNEPRTMMTEEEILKLFPKFDASGRRYTTTPLHAPGETRNGETGKQWNGMPPPRGRHWRISPKELSKLEKAGLIERSATGNPRKIIYADEISVKGKKVQDVWDLKDPQYPVYPTEKNIELLKRIIASSSNPGDIVLDCFAGSGTTLAAAELLGRRWIGIDSSKIAIAKTIKKLKGMPGVSRFTIYKSIE